VDCDSPCADRVVVLNAIISPKVKALLIPVISLHFPNLSFSCMIDCGSSHCFIDLHYAKVNHFPIVSVPHMGLRLIDGLSPSYIMHATDIPVQFPCRTTHQVRFLITKLDTKFPAVLGLDWLTLHNPLINWADSSVTFRDHPEISPVTTTQSDLANQEELPSDDDTSQRIYLILLLSTFRNQLPSLSQTQLLVQFLFQAPIQSLDPFLTIPVIVLLCSLVLCLQKLS
jgi:hypothetical protein